MNPIKVLAIKLLDKMWRAECQILELLNFRSSTNKFNVITLDFEQEEVIKPPWIDALESKHIMFAAGDTIQNHRTDVERHPHCNIFCYNKCCDTEASQSQNEQYAKTATCGRSIVFCQIDFYASDQCRRFAQTFENSIDSCNTDDSRYYLAENYVLDILKPGGVAHNSQRHFHCDIPLINDINQELMRFLEKEGYAYSIHMDNITNPVHLAEHRTYERTTATGKISKFLGSKKNLPDCYGINIDNTNTVPNSTTDMKKAIYGFVDGPKPCPLGYKRNFICSEHDSDFRVSIAFAASGSVCDYSESDRTAILRTLTTVAGLPASTPGIVTITAKVRIEAVLDVGTAADANAATSSLSATISTTDQLKALLAANGLNISVKSAPLITTFQNKCCQKLTSNLQVQKNKRFHSETHEPSKEQKTS